MRRAIAFVALLGIVASIVPAQTYDSITEEQFEIRLDELSRDRSRSMRRMLFGIVGALTGFVGGTVVATLNGAGRITENSATWGTVASYVVAGSGGVFSVWSFVRWRDSTDEYLETLRLQTRYWTLVRPR